MNKKYKILAVFCIMILTGGHVAYGQKGAKGKSYVPKQKSVSAAAKEDKKPEASTKAATDPKDKGLTHEISFSLDYNISNGTAEPAGSEASNITENEISLNLSYGYLFKSNNLEPIVELEYNSFTTSIDDYTGTDVTNKMGIGLLVNLPLSTVKGQPGTFDTAKWIPFIGFLLTNNITNLENGQTSSSKVDDTQMITKLTFGNRFRLVDNVSINSWIRLSYENSNTGATDSSEGGAKTSKLKVEVRLLSLSLLL